MPSNKFAKYTSFASLTARDAFSTRPVKWVLGVSRNGFIFWENILSSSST